MKLNIKRNRCILCPTCHPRLNNPSKCSFMEPAFGIREQTQEDLAEPTLKPLQTGVPHHLTTGLQWWSSFFTEWENTCTNLIVWFKAWIRRIQPVSHLQKQRFSNDSQDKSKHGTKIHFHGFQAHVSNCPYLI